MSSLSRGLRREADRNLASPLVRQLLGAVLFGAFAVPGLVVINRIIEPTQGWQFADGAQFGVVMSIITFGWPHAHRALSKFRGGRPD